MTEAQLGELSRVLFYPWTFLLYIGAAAAYFFRFAYADVDRDDDSRSRLAVGVGRLGIGLAVVGLGAHLASIITRSLAAGVRVPWGNMYEYSSVVGFGVVLVALAVVHWRMKRPELVGFALLAALLMMGSAVVLYTPAGPLMPALQTHWMKIHVFAMMGSSSIFIIAFVFTGLYLLRDLAERRLAERQDASLTGSTVGAAYAPDALEDESETHDVDDRARPAEDALHASDTSVLDDSGRSRPEGYEDDAGLEDRGAYGVALREAVNPIPIAISAAAITLAYSLLFQNPVATIVAPLVVGLGTIAAWWALPSLPSAATLDSLAYRTTAFAFPILTFGVIAGAVWAEQSWGRYWGWDPKETGAFLTWVGYAGYLHARATRGLRGRGAAGIGIVAFLLLMFTYYAVNLWVTGLHSYAGSGASTSNPPWIGIGAAIAIYAGVRFVTSRSRTAT